MSCDGHKVFIKFCSRTAHLGGYKMILRSVHYSVHEYFITPSLLTPNFYTKRIHKRSFPNRCSISLYNVPNCDYAFYAEIKRNSGLTVWLQLLFFMILLSINLTRQTIYSSYGISFISILLQLVFKYIAL